MGEGAVIVKHLDLNLESGSWVQENGNMFLEAVKESKAGRKKTRKLG